MLALIVRLLRTASIVICLIVAASFLVFAANQTKSASNQQQETVAASGNGTTVGKAGTTTSTGTTPATTAPKKENSVHKALDEASSSLTSPFAGIVSFSDSEWATRGVRLLLALVVYGFGLGYVARMLRVRV